MARGIVVLFRDNDGEEDILIVDEYHTIEEERRRKKFSNKIKYIEMGVQVDSYCVGSF